MPRPFPAEFRLRAVALVRAGKTVTATAAELGTRTDPDFVHRCQHWLYETDQQRLKNT
ncbi:hypothetical protein [Kocuria rhizosphaericola]|uniref:hypothetical protein n=1 Tax=Kocuria rhizosphaericola TaxID=3376284 RepID=UPI0037B4DA0E